MARRTQSALVPRWRITDSPEFESLYQRHVIASYEKQLHLGEVIGNRSWSFSTSDCLLTFRDGKARWRASAPMLFTTQLLGTVSDGDSSWLWSCANDASQIPATLIQDACRLRDGGTAPEWATANFELDLDDAEDHQVAMTSCGILRADAYYRGPY